MYEDKVQAYWKKHKIEKKALEANPNGKKWYFLDGPPYATGNIHMGTALNKILKDYYLRVFRMKGRKVHCQPGYDCHGLPIENKVEKALGFKGKDDIEKYGVKKFITECRKYATKYIDVMSKQFEDLGVWMDWDNPYLTLKKEYIEGAWITFKKAHEKGLLYKGAYPVHVCPRCETAVAYNEIIYEKLKDTSVYVRFKLKNKDEYLLIWTTTPWTLPANTGVMAHPKHEYVLVETQAGKLWLAKELLTKVTDLLECGHKVLKTVKGKSMEGWEYEPVLDLPLQEGVDRRVVMSDRYVHMEEGSGLVHTAPGHGLEDFMVGQQAGLKQLCPFSLNGKFTKEAGKYAGVFAKDADKIIIDDLTKTGDLLKTVEFEHEYPLCWRCNTPLLFLSVPQWFFKITAIKEDLIAQNSKIPWQPRWAGKRFDDWLQNLGDWPISRQRYWNIPLPIWQCDCGEIKVIGSAKELPKKMKDLHKPEIDAVKLKCEKCGRKMTRVPDVLDVWFDSGVAPWASLDFPSEDTAFNQLWPVDFVLEGPDQTRGWWNSLAICGMITMGRIPFERIMQHGLVLAESGVKMSKSKDNVVEPKAVVKKMGRDVLRYSLLRWDTSTDFDFSWEKAEEVKKFFNILDNTFKFFDLYCKPQEMDGVKLLSEDEWMVSRVNSLLKECDEYNTSFQGHKAVQAVEEFVVNDLSRWYVKLIRSRTWPTYEGDDKKAAFATFYFALDVVNKLLAPAIPYKTEDFNRKLFKKESVHLELLPELQKPNKEIEEHMKIVREIVEDVAAKRQKAGLKQRWPIRAVYVETPDRKLRDALEKFDNVLMSSCNAKFVEQRFISSTLPNMPKVSVEIEDQLDESLLREALANEVIRTVQQLRKKEKMDVSDKILLHTECAPLTETLKSIEALVVGKVNAKKYTVGGKGKHAANLKFQEHEVSVSFSKT